ncbi:MAG: glycosyltransferase [Natronospirillum sp.]
MFVGVENNTEFSEFYNILKKYIYNGKNNISSECARVLVVTTNHTGCRDAIIPDETGLLVPPRDAIALADAIQRLLEDAELRNKLGNAGRILAEQAFDIDNIVEQHLDIYRELLTNETG